MAKQTTAGKSKKTAQSKRSTKTNNGEATARAWWMMISCIVAVLLVIFMYIDSSGAVNGAVKSVLMGLFGNTAYIIPVTSVILTIYFVNRKDMKRYKIKSVLTFFILVTVSAIIHLISRDVGSVAEAYDLGIAGNGGGFLGAVTAYGLYVLFRRTASVVVLVFILLVLFSFVTRVSIFSAVFTFIKGMFADVKDEAGNINKVDNSQKAVKIKKEIKSRQRERRENAARDDIIDIPLDMDIPAKKSENSEDKKTADVSVERVELPKETESVEEIIETAEEEIKNTDEILDEINGYGNDTSFEDIFSVPMPSEHDNHSDSEQDITGKSFGLDREKKITNEEKHMLNSEIENALESSDREYIFPSIDFLTKTTPASADTRQEMFETATRLIEILKNFGVEAKLLKVTNGPSVTRYEIQPATGTKLNKIAGLADDIALNLAVQTVLIAPVPGKAAIGIEVPNKEVAPVYLRELIESDEFVNAKSKLSVVLGKDISGKAVVGDIAKMPHALIAGATGSGKSVCINTIITSILYKATPDEVKMIMVDPKVVELGVYNGIPHLLIPVVTDPKHAAASLNWAVQEMMKRYDLFAQTGVRNLEGYNKLMDKNGEKRMPQILIIIDELADLMMVAAKEVEDYICRLAQLARAAGIHLIIATQRPSVDVITGLIKANVPSRIAFAVSSQVDSRTILNRGGADKLLGRGDMLYSPMGARAPLRVQGAFVSDGEIENIVTFLKETSDMGSYSEDLAEHIERCATGENGVTPDVEEDGDALLPQAIELAVSMGQISTSMIQRKFRIGYSRAGRIIDQMEQRGIVGGPNGSKPRDVLINHADLAE